MLDSAAGDGEVLLGPKSTTEATEAASKAASETTIAATSADFTPLLPARAAVVDSSVAGNSGAGDRGHLPNRIGG